MSANDNFIKQIVAVRRKPDMTRKEFLNHRFQVPGTISDAPEDPDIKPEWSSLIHLFDGALGGRPDALNANQPWVGRDDITELYFWDWAHLKNVFTSEHVKTHVRPDGLNFSDMEAPLPIMAREKSLPLRTTRDLDDENGQVPKEIGIQPKGMDLAAYFGGSSMPTYHLAYKIFLNDRASVTAVRKAQKAFYENTQDELNQSESFVVFGIEGLIMDIGANTRFDPKRQPEMPDL
ncbi:uncharacterized protein BO95DRAFT_368769 [Aspergillus brunneoviolaceus CBS 621.78]|uniref:Uncharacterized protein n=1 Tax=Aspergillus brunneoviolaceus CBS 621.78 TaxID=1450534 RepID=A0ACD1G2F2_9EURO|nr:hypothetical protein BO95DRAFT_368769 [Aspergillus brunneoviolaceus CBS 621.78]RAH43372.1 hypothetical protein BO95DRAFT_368769 [Aspergillus brunneoviolaceus CBS 621.78]